MMFLFIAFVFLLTSIARRFFYDNVAVIVLLVFLLPGRRRRQVWVGLLASSVMI